MSRRLLQHRTFTATTTSPVIPSIGFSGAGFLGCYHVGVAACLHKHSILPDPINDNSYDTNKMPLLTGVSAGSMIASATLAGVNPEPDGMEVVLTAARRTRELQNKQQLINHANSIEIKTGTADRRIRVIDSCRRRINCINDIGGQLSRRDAGPISNCLQTNAVSR